MLEGGVRTIWLFFIKTMHFAPLQFLYIVVSLMLLVLLQSSKCIPRLLKYLILTTSFMLPSAEMISRARPTERFP